MALALVKSGQIVGIFGLALVLFVMAFANYVPNHGTLILMLSLFLGLILIVYSACENFQIPKP